MEKESNVTIEVLDMAGRRVLAPITSEMYAVGNHNFEIQLGDIPSGTYVLNVKAGSDNIIEKFVVVK
jgi:hypothetical protein